MLNAILFSQTLYNCPFFQNNHNIIFHQWWWPKEKSRGSSLLIIILIPIHEAHGGNHQRPVMVQTGDFNPPSTNKWGYKVLFLDIYRLKLRHTGHSLIRIKVSRIGRIRPKPVLSINGKATPFEVAIWKKKPLNSKLSTFK